MKYLLDTNIVICLLTGSKEIAQAIEKVGFENCAISEITKAKLLAGYYKSIMKGRNPNAKLLDFLNVINVVNISWAVDCYSRELARLQLEGTVIDDFDLLIASTAVASNMILVTDNVEHLERVKGTVIEDWISK